DGIGEAEGVQGGVPVAKLVAGREAGDTQSSSVGHRFSDLFLGGSGTQRVQQRLDISLWVIFEQLVGKLRPVVPGAALRLPFSESAIYPLESVQQYAHQVNGVPPGVAFLLPASL